jgi:hypothetical protein
MTRSKYVPITFYDQNSNDLDDERASRFESRMKPSFKDTSDKINYSELAQQARFDKEGQELIVKAKIAYEEIGRVIGQLEFRGDSSKKYKKLQAELLKGWTSNSTKLPLLIDEWSSLRKDPRIIDILVDQANRTNKKLFVHQDDDEEIDYIDIDSDDLGIDKLDINDYEFEFLKEQVISIQEHFLQLKKLLELNPSEKNKYKELLDFESAINKAINETNITDIRILLQQWNADLRNMQAAPMQDFVRLSSGEQPENQIAKRSSELAQVEEDQIAKRSSELFQNEEEDQVKEESQVELNLKNLKEQERNLRLNYNQEIQHEEEDEKHEEDEEEEEDEKEEEEE